MFAGRCVGRLTSSALQVQRLSAHLRPIALLSSSQHRPRYLSITPNTMATPHPSSAFQPDKLKFLDDLYKLMIDEALLKGTNPDTPVIDFKQPQDLQKLMKLTVAEEGASHDELLQDCKTVIDYSVQTAHPHFFNQFYSGRDPYSMGAAWLLEALNTNQHTFEVAPALILIERYLIEKLNSFTGYTEGDGVFCPGGQLANLCAIHLARYNHDKSLKEKGLFNNQRLFVFTSEEAHYSTKAATHVLGLGTDSLVLVKTDGAGRIIPSDFEQKVLQTKKEGGIPLAIVATAGTTVLGAYDPLNPIADICEQHGIWLHVDGAWGGAVVLSDKHKHLLDGLHRADSFLWNGHKMLGVQLQCTALLTKKKGLLEDCNNSHASYLYQADKFYDLSYDTGDKTIQCGRKADAIKWWMMWKARGDAGMRAIVENSYSNSQYFTNKLRETEGFRLTMPEFESSNICFWYIPSRLRGQEETEEWWQQVGKVTAKIKEGMVRSGTLMIGYQPMDTKGWVNFFRIIINNAILETKDMDFVVEEIIRLGKDL